MELVRLTPDQLVMLIGLGVVLFVILMVLKFAFKLTAKALKLGCLGILILLAVAFFALLALP